MSDIDVGLHKAIDEGKLVVENAALHEALERRQANGHDISCDMLGAARGRSVDMRSQHPCTCFYVEVELLLDRLHNSGVGTCPLGNDQ